MDDHSGMSLEQAGIIESKQKPFVPQEFYLIIHTPGMMACLPETPIIEQTKTSPEDGAMEETVDFCRVDWKGYQKICEWIAEGECNYLEIVKVMFEGKPKLAIKPCISPSYY